MNQSIQTQDGSISLCKYPLVRSAPHCEGVGLCVPGFMMVMEPSEAVRLAELLAKTASECRRAQ